MDKILETIIQKIEERNPRHAKKLRGNMEGLEDTFYYQANEFFDKYLDFVDREGKDLDYGIDSYMKMIRDYMYEQVTFAKTGSYSCTSFEDANERVYNNPEVMDYYMHGLMLSQFLWRHHYEVFEFFNASFPNYASRINSYLEIGGGHGIFLSEAMKATNMNKEYHLVDISPSSIEIAKGFVGEEKVKYFLTDIFDFHPKQGYDFITMGEVLEHVEQPLRLLKKLHAMLSERGRAFITAPANAPAIDHIYLFRNADDIRQMLDTAGFKVLEDISIYAERVSRKKAEKYKVAEMYGAFIEKK
ncbi:MAG: class I SAM-dependent methyltransferase [Bacteroidota bacterium]